MEQRKQEMIRRIMKLLELGNAEKNSNEHEREAAMNKAAQLMAEEAISYGDLRSEKPDKNSFIRFDVDGSTVAKQTWESYLAGGISSSFDCQIVNTYARQSDNHWIIAFMGDKGDVEIAVFFFKSLRRTITQMAKLNANGNGRNNYCLGMVMTISERLEALYKKREAFIPSDCTALIVVKKDAIKEFVKDQFPHLVSGRRARLTGDIASYHKGVRDGHKVNLNRPIEGSNSRSAQIGGGS